MALTCLGTAVCYSLRSVQWDLVVMIHRRFYCTVFASHCLKIILKYSSKEYFNIQILRHFCEKLENCCSAGSHKRMFIFCSLKLLLLYCCFSTDLPRYIQQKQISIRLMNT